jgi:mannosylglucosylglycerate synthase
VRAAVISYRLGQADGVSVEAAKWTSSLRRLGFHVITLAGEGNADVIVPALTKEYCGPTKVDALTEVLDGVHLVVVENLLSLPMNRHAARTVANILAGRPAILHHHDMPWQRAGYDQDERWPPDDDCWRHVTINESTRQELERRGIDATTIRNTIRFPVPEGRGEAARRILGVQPGQALVLQPTRAIARKNIPAGLQLASAIQAVFWLTGPAEDGYQEVLERLLANHAGPIRRGLPAGMEVADAYRAADVVAFPSLFEGFGNPVIESAAYRKPLAVAGYPVLDELRRCGFRWFRHDDYESIQQFIAMPDNSLLDHNEKIVRESFSSVRLDEALAREVQMLGLLASGSR